MKVSFDDGNYPEGYNLDRAALNGLDVINKNHVPLYLRNGEGGKLIIPKSFLII